MKKIHNAFTLIEVLIALLIIAIALAAAIRATSTSIRTARNVKNTMIAHFVAMNVLSEIQTQLLPLPHSDRAARGSTRMLNQTWQWSAIINGTSNNIMRVRVTVKQRNHNITSVTGYAEKK